MTRKKKSKLGPATQAGRDRISEAQVKRWADYRADKAAAQEKKAERAAKRKAERGQK